MATLSVSCLLKSRNPKHYYNLTLHYRDLYHGCNHWTNQIGSLEVLNLIDTS